MADQREAGISWTDETWNPVVGCSIVSPACTNCYAMAMAARIERMAPAQGRQTHYAGTTRTVNGKPVWTGKLALAPDHIVTAPLRWKRPRRVFVNSMSDLFHEDMPLAWIATVFAVMALAREHTLQVLTKRPEVMRCILVDQAFLNLVAAEIMRLTSEFYGPEVTDHIGRHHEAVRLATHVMDGKPLPNVWLGATAEDQVRADERIPHLLATPAVVRFVSAEPLLGPIDVTPHLFIYTHADNVRLADESDDVIANPLDFNDPATTPAEDIATPRLDWVIAGGESGPGARPTHPDWFRAIRDQCADAGVAFHFKQWGEWIGVPDLRRLPGGAGPGFGVFDHCAYDMDREAVRVGKRRAGRLLDGQIHDAFPEPRQ